MVQLEMEILFLCDEIWNEIRDDKLSVSVAGQDQLTKIKLTTVQLAQILASLQVLTTEKYHCHINVLILFFKFMYFIA